MIGDTSRAVNSSRRALWRNRHTSGAKDIWYAAPSFANLATTTCLDERRCTMFEELSEELLDLSANVRGVGSAVYAASQDDPGSCGIALCCSIVLCCCCAICT
jgi:hypothetical protein